MADKTTEGISEFEGEVAHHLPPLKEGANAFLPQKSVTIIFKDRESAEKFMKEGGIVG